MEPIRYSKYIDDSCCILSEAAESTSDVVTVHLTRLHGLAQKITQTFSPDGHLMNLNFAAAPAGAFVKALQMDLLQLHESLPASFRHSSRQLLSMSSKANSI